VSETPAGSTVGNVEAILRQRLAVLVPTRLEVIDDSARHAGHAGAKGGGGHYRLLIVATTFAGQARLARHRLIHAALGDLLQTRIHALSIQALTPAEVASTDSMVP
jgi:BolA protein